MSRLAATKEFAFMKALHMHNFSVPTPIDHNRHCVIMELVDGIPLTQVAHVGDVGKLYADLMAIILRLASHGLVHGDFNEFNLLIKESNQNPILIDFPQMISTKHANADEQFARDVNCVRLYFRRRFDFDADWWPRFDVDVVRNLDLDASLAASGACSLTKKQHRELELFLEQERERSLESNASASDASDSEEGDNEDDDDNGGQGSDSIDVPAEEDISILSLCDQLKSAVIPDPNFSTPPSTSSCISMSISSRDTEINGETCANHLAEVNNGTLNNEDSPSEGDGSENEIVATPNNRSFQAFRDQGAMLQPTPPPTPVRNRPLEKLSPEEIKRRVQMSTNRPKSSKIAPNMNKTRCRKTLMIRENVKYGASDDYA
jgi:RIO kinase 2